MPVLSIPLDIDFRYLESKNTFIGAQTIAGVAAQFGFIQLFNPKTSGILAVITKAWSLPKLVADQPYFAIVISASALGAPPATNTTRVDSRIIASKSSAQFNVGTAASIGVTNLVEQVQYAATTDRVTDFILTRETHVPILPGDAAFIASNTANTILTAGLTWYERPLDESEAT